MIRISTYLFLLSAAFLGGCKALEPIEQSFFLGKFVDQKPAEPVVRETYPVLVFRTPGYEIWSKKNANLEVGDALHPLSVGQVEVIERYNPAGQILSVVLAELEATSKYPLEPGQVCFGRFGLLQGTLPEGTDLNAPLTAQADQLGPQGR
jgi:hypothetical protein